MTDHDLLLQISGVVTSLEQGIADLKEDMEKEKEETATFRERMSHLCEDLGRLLKDYYGNGEGGTRRDVTMMKTKMGLLFGLGGVLASAVITSLVAAILDLVVY